MFVFITMRLVRGCRTRLRRRGVGKLGSGVVTIESSHFVMMTSGVSDDDEPLARQPGRYMIDLLEKIQASVGVGDMVVTSLLLSSEVDGDDGFTLVVTILDGGIDTWLTLSADVNIFRFE